MIKLVGNVKLKYLWKYLPFWMFLMFFKFGACLHYNLLSPFGERVLPVWIVGLVIGAASLMQLLFDVPAGFILDKYGYKRFLKITTLIFMVSILVLLWKLNLWTYLITVFLSCFGWLFFGPGANAYVISHAPKKQAGCFLSFRDMFESMGVVLSSAIFIFTLSLPVRMVGVVILTLLTATFIAINFAPEDVGLVHQKKKLKTQNYYIRRQYLIKVIKAISRLNPASVMLLLTGLTSSIFYALIWFVVPLMLAHNMVPGVMSWALGIFDLAIVLMGFILGKVADRVNKKKLVFIGLLMFSITGMILGFHFGIVFLLLGFLATTGDEMSTISLWLWLNTLDKNHDEDGLVSGVINLFQDLGWAIGPVMAGFLYSNIGPEWTIAAGGMLVFLVWIIYCLKLGKSHSYFSLSSEFVENKPHRFRHKR